MTDVLRGIRSVVANTHKFSLSHPLMTRGVRGRKYVTSRSQVQTSFPLDGLLFINNVLARLSNSRSPIGNDRTLSLHHASDSDCPRHMFFPLSNNLVKFDMSQQIQSNLLAKWDSSSVLQTSKRQGRHRPVTSLAKDRTPKTDTRLNTMFGCVR